MRGLGGRARECEVVTGGRFRGGRMLNAIKANGCRMHRTCIQYVDRVKLLGYRSDGSLA